MAEDRAGGSAQGPGPSRLWRLLNTPRTFDPRTARIAVAILATIATSDAFLRYDPQHQAFFWVRCAIGAFCVPGVVLMGRFSFAQLRLYTLGVATLLPLSVGWICASGGYGGPEIALTGACIFVGIVFLQTGVDVLIGIAIITATQGALLLAIPPRSVAIGSVAINVATAICAGTATVLILIGYRARLQESLQWWRDACERERAALRHKSEFLSTMSHELRSPLHVIIGYVDLLRDEIEEAHAHPLGRIRDSALDLLQLVDHTLQAARLEAGKLALCIDDVDCAVVVRELAENIATLPEAKKGIPVHWRVLANLPVARLDRLKLKEVVQNLVSNALKYTVRGAVMVEVGVDRAALRIDVHDTGPGIPSEALGRIFDMFERVDETVVRRQTGVGLGLYIVHGLVAMMGGRIAVESVVGEGSHFTVWLPLGIESTPCAA